MSRCGKRGRGTFSVYAPRMARTKDRPNPPRVPADLHSQRDPRLTGDSDFSRLTIAGDFSGANLSGMTVEESHIRHSAFLSADLGRLRLVDVLVEDSDFAGAEMPEASFTRVTFRRCRMSGALMAQAQLRDVTFSESKLDDVNFRMCQGDRVVFDDVNLQRADFYAAHLTSARFFDCDMKEAEVSQAILPRARFHGSVLSDIRGGEYLRNVVIESAQVLPLAIRVFSALDIRVEDEREASDT